MDGLNAGFETETAVGRVPGAAARTHASSGLDAAIEDHDENELLLDFLGRWEERFRRGENASPESLGVTDPAVLEALGELIKRQKRLYKRLNLAEMPADGAAGADEPLLSFPDHETLGLIGQGGMGVVYKARDRKLGRVVAIKTIAEGQNATPDQRERFRAEAQAVARLRHPNIIAIHAIGEHKGRPYLSLEFAEGGSLAQEMAKRPTPTHQAAELVETLARAVHAAHQAGIVHRDLKPSNVLLTVDGVPKVSDFGLAKLMDADSARTASGQVMGSPSFMAPEQAEGRSKTVGPAADVYALGAILYQALTGKPPFLGESQLETLKLVTSSEVVCPRRLRPDVPRDLETSCLKCLEREPRKRYSSAAALANDLRRFLDGKPILARPASAPERALRWCRRNPWVAAFLVALLLGVVGSIWQAVRATLAEAATRKEWGRAEEETAKARQSEAAAQADRARAESESAIATAINEFLKKDLLARASPNNQSGLGSKPDPDLKLRTVLDLASGTISARFAAQPVVEASIRQTIGETYTQLGLYPQARTHLERALELRRRELGPGHADTFIAMNRLGALHLADTKLAEAESLLVPAMEGLRRTLGPDHPESLTAMNDVASLYPALDRFDEAEHLFVQVLNGRRRVRGPDHPETLEVMSHLANLYLMLGGWQGNKARPSEKLRQAEQLLIQALEAYQRRLEAEHPSALAAKTILASVQRALGRDSEAVRLLNEVLGGQRGVLGNKHPDTLLTMVVLADMYHRQKQWKDAESLLLEAVAGCRSALDRNHETAVAALAVLSSVYALQGDLKKLGPVLVEARDIALFRWGPDHAMTFNGNLAVGMFYVTQREYVKAEPSLRDSLKWLARNQPEGSDRFVIEGLVGVSLLGQKKHAEARPLLFAAYAGIEARESSVSPSAKPSIARIVRSIAQLYHETGASRDDKDFARIWSDPEFQAARLDVEFPAQPLAKD